MSADPDVIVVGSGPNGLVAACALAQAGIRVLVLEAHRERFGGAVGSEHDATLPGFVHDVGAAFYPWAALSPAFRALDLAAHGLRWLHAPVESCHPAPDGSVAILTRGTDGCDGIFGDASDVAALSRTVGWYRGIERPLLDALLRPLVDLRAGRALLPTAAARVASMFVRSGRGLSESLFRSTAARRVLPGLALHVDVGPDDTFGAGLGFMLGMTATTGGYAVPAGGAASLTHALLSLLRAHGGEARLGTRVVRVLSHDGRASGVRTATGEDVPARVGVLADTDVVSLLVDLVEREYVSSRLLEGLGRFQRGWGTFKLDWALAGPVPWACDEARRAAVVHAGDSLDDLSRFTAEVRGGKIPERPYLVVGQQSLVDPSRAPEGRHTLWAYSRVPPRVPGGWPQHADAFADRVEARLEELAPGFRSRILARRAVSPPDLEAMDANLVGGDLGGGSNAWHRLLVFRPIFPWFRYRTPLPGLYLGSSYAHPGAGVHGMCGWNAAQALLADLGAIGDMHPP
jgi:phytoene dehydrogenase-like protein